MKAPNPIDVRLLPPVTEVILEHPWKDCLLIVVKFLEKITLPVKLEQSLNASVPIDVTETGRLMAMSSAEVPLIETRFVQE
jgi:hypothetical protein